MILSNLAGPPLYAATTKSQSPNCLYRMDRNLAAACVLLLRSVLSSLPLATVNPKSLAVPGMSCQGPTAPAEDNAFDFKSDSITAKYLSVGAGDSGLKFFNGEEIGRTPCFHFREALLVNRQIVFHKTDCSWIQFIPCNFFLMVVSIAWNSAAMDEDWTDSIKNNMVNFLFNMFHLMHRLVGKLKQGWFLHFICKNL